MGYRKDTDKAAHEERVKAILDHTKLAKERQDARLAEAIRILERTLDDRRSVPWKKDDWEGVNPTYLAAEWRFNPITIGKHIVEFETEYGRGAFYSVSEIREDDEDRWDTVVTVPCSVNFDPAITVANFDEAEAIALDVAKLLERRRNDRRIAKAGAECEPHR